MSQQFPRESSPTLTDRMRVLTRDIIDPIVTVLARLHISPNLLTIVGMLLHIFYAWLIANGYMTAAGIMILVFVPLDALDGALARKIGSTGSKFGAFLDSTSDRIAEIILFAGYIYYFGMQDEPWLVAASYIAITGSIMVSYARSRAEALGISCKVGLFSRVERYVLIVATLVLSIPEWGVVILAVGSCFTVGQRVYHVWKQSNLLALSQESDT